MRAGHLFIVRGDLLKLACSAWLLPTDASGSVSRFWRDAPGLHEWLDGRRLKVIPDEWSRGEVTAVPVGPPRSELPIAVPVGAIGFSPPLLKRCVAAFLETAEGTLTDSALTGRSRQLLALPLIGTGHGGADLQKGGAVDTVVRELLERVPNLRVDVALVLDNEPKFAAAQAVRRRVEDGKSAPDPWASLPSRVAQAADTLGGQGLAGRLVVFFGAGMSVGAGLPDWSELLDGLAARANFTGSERGLLKRLDPRDRALLVQQKLGVGKLRSAVEGKLQKSHHSLGHALLANLPASDFVTTNYDTLFESAFAAAGRSLRVLPDELTKKAPAWLLKLHGSIGKRDLVLTRTQYSFHARNRAALNGIVQALLMTRHMLFVGYSLKDEDFHQVVDEVLAATGHLAAPLGTALMADASPFEAQLWRKTLSIVPTIKGGETGLTNATTEGGSLVEIALDRVIAQAAVGNVTYLLDPAFDSLLNKPECAVAQHVRDLNRELRGTERFRSLADTLLRGPADA